MMAIVGWARPQAWAYRAQTRILQDARNEKHIFCRDFSLQKVFIVCGALPQRAPSINITTATAYETYISMLAIAKIRMVFKKRLFSEQFLF
jgi:hypothetical protein